MLRVALRVVAPAVVLLILSAPVALGHAELTSANPGPSDKVLAPAQIVARFSQDLDLSRTSLEVRDAGGGRVAQGGKVGDGPREVRLPLPTLQPGVYEVRWTSFSAEDGELARGSYSFTVASSPTAALEPSHSISPSLSPSVAPSALPPPAASPAPTPDAPLTPPSESSPIDVAVPIAVALVFASGLGSWLIRRSGR